MSKKNNMELYPGPPMVSNGGFPSLGLVQCTWFLTHAHTHTHTETFDVDVNSKKKTQTKKGAMTC